MSIRTSAAAIAFCPPDAHALLTHNVADSQPQKPHAHNRPHRKQHIMDPASTSMKFSISVPPLTLLYLSPNQT